MNLFLDLIHLILLIYYELYLIYENYSFLYGIDFLQQKRVT